MAKLNIITLNVRGLRGNKRYSIYNWFKENKFDICLTYVWYRKVIVQRNLLL